MNLTFCRLAAGVAPAGCDWCGHLLNGQQTRWCSDECFREFRVNHWWTDARAERLRRDNYRCIRPGCLTSTDRVQVNHIVPLNGRPRSASCLHHQSGLETLCHQHHVQATNRQRAAGLLGPNGVGRRPG